MYAGNVHQVTCSVPLVVAGLIKAKPNPGHLYRLGTTAMSGFIPSVLIIIVLGYAWLSMNMIS